jgi:hypothetical protein
MITTPSTYGLVLDGQNWLMQVGIDPFGQMLMDPHPRAHRHHGHQPYAAVRIETDDDSNWPLIGLRFFGDERSINLLFLERGIFNIYL